jgi:hypothetical protein
VTGTTWTTTWMGHNEDDDKGGDEDGDDGDGKDSKNGWC